jgi:hypothetical protein
MYLYHVLLFIFYKTTTAQLMLMPSSQVHFIIEGIELSLIFFLKIMLSLI